MDFVTKSKPKEGENEHEQSILCIRVKLDVGMLPNELCELLPLLVVELPYQIAR